MNPTLSQLNARNTAVGAPITDNGDYSAPGQKNATPSQYGTMQNGSYIATPSKVVGQPASEQTVISSGNINDKVIPEDQQRLQNLSTKGTSIGADGVTRLADGSVDTDALRQQGGFYQAEDGNKYFNYDSSPYTESSAITPDEQSTFNDLKKNLDATTKQSLDVAHQVHDLALQKQNDLNQKTLSSTSASLLDNGTTRYAPKDNAGYLATITKEGTDKVSQLDADENQLIAQANVAQANGDKDILNSKLNLIEKVRAEKQAQVDKLTDQTNAHIQDLQTQKEQADKDSAIAQQISNGVTDPNEILKNLQANGNTTVTAKDIATTLANVTPQAKAIMDLLQTAKNNGAPADVLAKIGKAQSLDDAMVASGDYGAGGTGIVAEYNYAKANGYSGTFSHYQTEDANRKASASASGGGTVAPGGTLSTAGQAWITAVLNGNATMAQVPTAIRNEVAIGITNQPQTAYSPLAASRFTTAGNKIVSNFVQLPQYQLTANGLPYLQRIDAAMKTPGSVSDQDLLDSLTKLNTAGNAISDAQVGLITDGRSFADSIDVFKNKFANGGTLSDNQRKQIQTIANAIYANYKKGYQPVYDQVTTQLKAAGIPEAFWTIPDLNNLSDQAQNGPGNSDAIVSDDKTATTALQTFDSADPKNQTVMDAMHSAFPNASALDIYNKLKSRGLIQ